MQMPRVCGLTSCAKERVWAQVDQKMSHDGDVVDDYFVAVWDALLGSVMRAPFEAVGCYATFGFCRGFVGVVH